MTHYFKQALGALAFAAMGCGAADEWPADELDHGDELGQQAAALSTSFTNTYQFGTQTNASKLQCDRVSAAQTCMIPSLTFVTWCANSAAAEFAAADRTTIRQVIAEFTEAFGNLGWTLQEIEPGADGICRISTNIRFKGGSVSGTLSNNIDGYSDVEYFAPTDLTEGASGDAVPTGNYQRYKLCEATIDTVDVKNKGTTADEDRNILRHAAGHGVLACMGFGTQTNAPTPFFAHRALMLDESGLPLTVGQQCIVSTFDGFQASDYSLTFSNCSTD